MLDEGLRSALDNVPGSLSDHINRAVTLYLTMEKRSDDKLSAFADELQVIADRLRILGSL